MGNEKRQRHVATEVTENTEGYLVEKNKRTKIFKN